MVYSYVLSQGRSYITQLMITHFWADMCFAALRNLRLLLDKPCWTTVERGVRRERFVYLLVSVLPESAGITSSEDRMWMCIRGGRVGYLLLRIIRPPQSPIPLRHHECWCRYSCAAQPLDLYGMAATGARS